MPCNRCAWEANEPRRESFIKQTMSPFATKDLRLVGGVKRCFVYYYAPRVNSLKRVLFVVRVVSDFFFLVYHEGIAKARLALLRTMSREVVLEIESM